MSVTLLLPAAPRLRADALELKMATDTNYPRNRG
jgi:hypothetical protein